MTAEARCEHVQEDIEGMDNAWPTRVLFGVPIQALTMNEVLGVIDDRIGRRQPLL